MGLEKLSPVARAVTGFARWYMRRGKITKALIIGLFLMVIFLYSYWKSEAYIAKYSNPPLVTGEDQVLSLPTVPCRTFFSGRTLYIFGPLTVPNNCYQLNSSVAVFTEDNKAVEIVLIGNKTSKSAIVLSLPVNVTIQAGNTTMHVSREILVIYHADFNNTAQAVAEALEAHNLTGIFCKVAIPSKGWGVRAVPEQVYDFVCLRRTP